MFKIIPERDIIYLCGLIDGEGSIYININNNAYTLCLEISMTDKPVLEQMHTLLGLGSFNPVRRKVMHKQAWKWVVTNSKAEEIIKLILPYMIVKKDQAIKALEFMEQKRLFPKDKRLHSEFYYTLRELKKIEFPIEN